LVNRCIVINSKGKLLLIKRSLENYYAPGLWEFPGGKLDEGQDLSNALEREVLEETGLLVLPLTRVAFTSSYIVDVGKYKGLPYVVIVGIGKSIGGSVVLSSEHTDYVWVDLKEAMKMPIKEEIRKSLIVLSKNIKQLVRSNKKIKTN
jgi:8-oxo-dGTP diphosphatase